MQEQTNPPANPTEPQPPQKPRKRRRLLKVLGVLVLLLILLVVFLPTIISLGPVRSFIVNQASGIAVPNGRLAIEGWSFGWFGATSINGVKVYDESNALVLSLDQLKTGKLSLLKLARQDFDLSGVVVEADATNITVYPDGTTNLHRIFGLAQSTKAPKPEKPEAATSDDLAIPNVHGDIELKLRGAVHVVDEAGKPITNLQFRAGSGGKIKIDDINKGVAPDLMFVYDVDGGAQSTVTVKGKVDAVENNKLDLDKLTAAIDLALTEIDVRAANTVLTMVGRADTQVKSGVVNGALAINYQPGAPSAKGEFVVKSPHVVTPELKDEYKADEIRLPIDVSLAGEGDAARIKVDTRLIAPEASVVITGDLAKSALDNLAKNQMPGSDSSLTLTVTADPKKVGSSFRNTLQLKPGLSIDGGEIKSVVDVLLKADRIDVKTSNNVALSATDAGKPITVPPITLNAGAGVTSLTDIVGGVRDIALSMKSDFLHFAGGGKSVADVKIEGGYDIARLQDLARQFADLGETQLAGSGKFAVQSWQDKQVRAEANIEGTGLRIALAGREPINLASLRGGVSAALPIDAMAGKVEKVDWVKGTLRLTPADKPLVDGELVVSSIDLAKQDVGSFLIEKGTVTDFRAVQTLIRPFIDLKKDHGIDLAGSAHLVTRGSVAGGKSIKLDHLTATLDNLDVKRDGKRLYADKSIAFSTAGDVQTDDAGTTVNLNVLDLQSAVAAMGLGKEPLTVKLVNGVPAGNGVIGIKYIDFTAVNAVVRSLAGPDAQLPVVTSGAFWGNITLATAAEKSTVALKGEVGKLTIDQTPIQNEKIEIALNAEAAMDAAGKPQSATVKPLIKSSFADISDATVDLKLAEGTPALQMLQKALLKVGIRDTARLQSLASALVPGLKLPVTVSSGTSVVVTVDKPGAVNLNLESSGLSLRNDKGQVYSFGRERVSLVADVAFEGADAVESITVNKLDGKFNMASVSAAEPIKITGLKAGGKLDASGVLKVDAVLEQAARLLQVVQAADQPMAFAGKLALTQTISTEGDAIKLKGSGTVDNFQALDVSTGKPQLTEPQVKIENDLVADTTAKAATINSLTLDMASSQAVKLTMSGGISAWDTQRQLNNIKFSFSSVGEKLWPILYAAMSPEQQMQFKDARLVGPITADFVALGAYPDAPTWNESIKATQVYGSVKLTSLNAMGMDVKSFDLPISLEKGLLVTGDMRKAKAERFAKPFEVNGGKGDFSSIVVNIADPAMPISIGRKQRLLQGVQLNEVMAAQVGSLASVLFKDANKASGIVDLMAVDCTNIPVADLQQGRGGAHFMYDVTDLRIDGLIPGLLSKGLNWGDQGIVGNIKNGTLVLKDGVAHQNMTLTLLRMVEERDPRTQEKVARESNEQMQFKGGIDLKTNRFKDYTLWLSRGIIPGEARSAFPQGATIELKGDVADVNSIMGQAVGGLIAEGLKNKAQEKIESEIGDRLKDIFKKKD